MLKIYNICSLAILLIVGYLLYLIWLVNPIYVSGAGISYAWCGGAVGADYSPLPEGTPPLFIQYCSACHVIGKKAIGPDLIGIGDRRNRDWIINWVHNSGEFISSGDSLAIAVYEEHNRVRCAPFPFLSEVQIDSLIEYLGNPPLRASPYVD